VIELVHKLGLRAVATGVDSAEALQLAREVGCDFGQGYHLGPPAAARSAERSFGLAA
jgi:EAL domain-containing protein (putative c-di-GMP-specific phosphodiesterase class I)